MLLFSRSLDYGFLKYDDPRYVTDNPHVLSGLSWAGAKWAFTGLTDYWHPLTWLSHQLDWQFYGEAAAGHHLTSALWHSLNAVLVLVLFRRLTGEFWTSAFAAAFFAWHPLRVESVAWITERKDVMSGCFFLLTLLTYLNYATRRRAGQPARGTYALTLGLFIAGLMSKPMLVTTPIVLLLLDFWPLRRVSKLSLNAADFRKQWMPLLLEKIPFFFFSVATSLVTIWMQKTVGAFVLTLPFSARLLNAIVAIARYLGHFFWPFDLAVCYQHPGYWPILTVVGASLLMLGLSALAWWRRESQPWLLFGWGTFLAVLLPAIGLIQVGFQSMADRYTYLPLLGIELAVFWSISHVATSVRVRGMAGVFACLLLAGLALRTWNQEVVWRDTVTLFRHATEVTDRNDVAYGFLGYTLLNAGKVDEAAEQAGKALAINPLNTTALETLATTRKKQLRFSEAITLYRAVLAVDANSAPSLYNLGLLLHQTDASEGKSLVLRALQIDPTLQNGSLIIISSALHNHQPAIAAWHATILLEINPDDSFAHFTLALACQQLGRTSEALNHFETAARLDAEMSQADVEAGKIMVQQGDNTGALTHFRAAVDHHPTLIEAQLGLARTLELLGNLEEAIDGITRAIAVNPDNASLYSRLAELTARHQDFPSAARYYQRAISLEPGNANSHAGLGYMMMLTGDRSAALKEWERALEIDPSLTELRGKIEQFRR